jgi:hypothetical protein
MSNTQENASSAVSPVTTEASESSVVPQVAESVHAGSAVPVRTTADQQRLDRLAEDLAEQGGRTEQRYDESHHLFTK